MICELALLVLPFVQMVRGSVVNKEKWILPRQANASATAAPSCAVDCDAYEFQPIWSWYPVSVTATVTAATIIHIIDERTNKTITSTKTADLPSDIQLPPINAAGTQTKRITVETEIGKSTVIDLAYPTDYAEKPLSYSWSGVLLTSTPGGQPVCSTAPAYVTVTYGPYTALSPTAPTETDSADPKGFGYALIPIGCHMPVNSVAAPNDAAPKLCSTKAQCAPGAVETVQFLTATSVSRTSSNPQSTPPAPAPPADPPTTPEPQLPSPNPSPSPNPVPSPNPAPSPSPTPSPNPAPSPDPAPSSNPGPSPDASEQPSPAPTGASFTPPTNQPVASDVTTITPAPTPGQASPVVSPTPAPVLIGNQPAVLDSSSNVVVAGQTIVQGSGAVISGTTISVVAGGFSAVVNGATQAIVPVPVITISNTPIVVNSEGAFVVSSSGVVSTIGSIATNAAGSTVAVVGGTTSSLNVAPSDDISGAIATGVELSNHGNHLGVSFVIMSLIGLQLLITG